MDTLFKDIRYGMRSLLKRPGFTATAVITLALGIGANTAIFSVVNAVLLRPLPYRDAERVATLWQNNVKTGVPRNEVSPANFLDWREQSHSFAAMAGIEPFGFSLADSGEPERFQAWLVTTGFFETLGSNALHGRTFAAEDYELGNEHRIVMSYGLWQRRFGGAANLIGQKLALNGQPYTVVGIMPPEFQFPSDRELWAPRVLGERDRQLRGATYWNVIGRLKPGVTVEQAQAEISAISARLEQQYPETNGGMGATVVTLPELLTGQVRRGLFLLLGAVGFVLLIACANVANLLLVRGAERQREFAIRSALGASRIRIVRQLLIENLLLAMLGGLGGLLLSTWGVRLLPAINSAKMPRIEHVNIDARVLLFVFGISILTAICFGLIPAAHLSRTDLQSTLKESGRGTMAGSVRHWLRNSLVVTEVALALVLLTGAGLLVRGFVSLLRVDPGFAKQRVLALQVFLPRTYQTEKVTGFFDQTLEKVAAVPGVEKAAVVSSPPFINLEQDAPFTIEGIPPPPPGKEPSAYYSEVSADYLSVMGVPLRRGRFFTRFDKSDTVPVVVINETMARRYFGNQDPVGKKLTVMFDPPEPREIVGVIGDVLHNGLDTTARPEMFVHYPQSPTSQMTFVVKTTADAGAMLPSVKAAIRAVNPNQTFSKTATMEQLIGDSLRQRRFNLFLLGSFAVLALALAGLGIYGLMSYSTRQRTHEIGVRMALGAQRRDILKLFIGQGLLLTLIGVVIGLAGALALTRLMAGLLFGVTPTDALTFATVPVCLIVVALLACYVPARRATKVDPLVALRYE